MKSGPLILLFLSVLLLRAVSATTKSYVVYLGGHAHDVENGVLADQNDVEQSHYKFLGTFLGDEEKARDAIFYSYTKHINGFAANLEEKNVLEISKHPSVVSVFPNRKRELLTTRSWSFLGLDSDGKVSKGSLLSKAKFGKDIIIANLDSGVWPESKSFGDQDMGPIPSKWKGICQNEDDKSFKCNKKLIGARYFHKGYVSVEKPKVPPKNSPRDDDGHGTHTLSTAGGSLVPGVNVNGLANGTAKGGSPAARVAAYKVCWGSCYEADIISGFDAAIHDGVDLISVSLGGPAVDYFMDGTSIGSFHAIRNGIPVVSAGGNDGPKLGSVSNVSPWLLTVAASTTDRWFPTYVSFGDKKLQGQSITNVSLQDGKLYPMINSKEASAANATHTDAELCLAGSLDPEKVRGKIVVCLRGKNGRMEKGQVVFQAGGAAIVLANDNTNGNSLVADNYVLPAIHISYEDGLSLYSYLKSTKSPRGFITPPGTAFGMKPSPCMADFSSMGPNKINPEIIKPDITAPGVNILAAYIPPQNYAFDSGTSMATPHVSGIVGLLKSIHPKWSPSAIKSSIMTTARTRDNLGEPITDHANLKGTPFNYGSGNVWPNRAMDPGLVYDLTIRDYFDFLCTRGYNSTQMLSFTAPPHTSTLPYTCPRKPLKIENLNYPSIAVPNLKSTIVVHRKLKNVGSPGTYKVCVRAPTGISVSVKPKTLEFKHVDEEKKFKVTIKAVETRKDYVFGEMIWSDGRHDVRSPIAVKAARKST